MKNNDFFVCTPIIFIYRDKGSSKSRKAPLIFRKLQFSITNHNIYPTKAVEVTRLLRANHYRLVFCNFAYRSNKTRHGLFRSITPVQSGRHYLQITDEIYKQTICHSSYFNALKSARRMSMVKAQEKQSYQLHSETLSSLGIDYLKQFPELDEYRVKAADGHFIQHACQTEKTAKGKSSPLTLFMP